jgi:hypothetical protein
LAKGQASAPGNRRSEIFHNLDGTFLRFDDCQDSITKERGALRIMPTSAARASVTSPDEHILTVQEALEPLFLALEEEAEVKMIAAAVKAGWSPEDAVAAIDELRRTELLAGNRPH